MSRPPRSVGHLGMALAIVLAILAGTAAPAQAFDMTTLAGEPKVWLLGLVAAGFAVAMLARRRGARRPPAEPLVPEPFTFPIERPAQTARPTPGARPVTPLQLTVRKQARTPPAGPPLQAYEPAPTPLAVPAITDDLAGTPIQGMPIIDEEIMVDRTDSNVAPASWRGSEISLTRSGSVDLRPSMGGGAAPPSRDDVTGEIDAATEEYRALFKEFISLRRTCGESVLNLDRDQFVTTLSETKRRLVERHAAKDVRFRLAFDNGKAAIRYTTVV